MTHLLERRAQRGGGFGRLPRLATLPQRTHQHRRRALLAKRPRVGEGPGAGLGVIIGVGQRAQQGAGALHQLGAVATVLQQLQQRVGGGAWGEVRGSC